MKILLSCVNSLVSLIGFDLEKKRSFWYCPANKLRCCGATYDQSGGALLLTHENSVIRIQPSGRIEEFPLPGPHRNLAHSIHCIGQDNIGVADTGNSRLLIYGSDLKNAIAYNPVEGWGSIPEDAIHLNDFAVTPKGLVASCFHYQPFRNTIDRHDFAWRECGYGLILSLEKHKKTDVSKVLASGLDCPHSLVWHDNALYCCSSATGDFIRMRQDDRGFLTLESRQHITSMHFLRGALPLDDGGWLLGGSSQRRKDDRGMALYRLRPDFSVEELYVAEAGEIYDILPWDEALMPAVTRILYNLPSTEDGENLYPPPCLLEE